MVHSRASGRPHFFTERPEESGQARDTRQILVLWRDVKIPQERSQDGASTLFEDLKMSAQQASGRRGAGKRCQWLVQN